jgi:beta-mannosidase
VRVATAIGGTDHAAAHPLAAGENTLDWSVTVDRPALWWPHALGPATLHDVRVAVLVDDDAPDPGGLDDLDLDLGPDGPGRGDGVPPGADPDPGRPSDERRFRVGLRSVRLRNWVASVNGERLFLKGANQGPTRMALGEATAAELQGDVALAVETGLDLLRVHAHVSRPELYDAADEAGLLLWQDMPLQWGYARGIRRQAVRQARGLVDLLGHHPSVAVWCGHNEPIALEDTEWPDDLGGKLSMAGRVASAQQLPTWNKTVLDGSIKRAFQRADGTRPVVPHSGVVPHPPRFDGTDAHLYFGWYWGDERQFPAFCRAVPRMARFVTEFGAQAVPTGDVPFLEPERWPDLDWERLAHTHGLQRSAFDRYVPPAEHATFESWQAATQRYQATLLKHHVETLRRLKYRPAGGFAMFSLADGHLAVSWSVVDHERRPKLGLAALREACRPVIVVADRLPAEVVPGDPLGLDIHVVSDRRTAVAGAEVTAKLSWSGGDHAWRWEGDVPPDDCVRVGTLQVVVPRAPGPLALDVELHLPDGERVANRYESRIA